MGVEATEPGAVTNHSCVSWQVMEEIAGREWGLLIMDEVHVVPAQMFRKVRLWL